MGPQRLEALIALIEGRERDSEAPLLHFSRRCVGRRVESLCGRERGVKVCCSSTASERREGRLLRPLAESKVFAASARFGRALSASQPPEARLADGGVIIGGFNVSDDISDDRVGAWRDLGLQVEGKEVPASPAISTICSWARPTGEFATSACSSAAASSGASLAVRRPDRG
jgi:hypothetical protein